MILPYILKNSSCINAICSDYESVLPENWPQNVNVGHSDLYFIVQYFDLYMFHEVYLIHIQHTFGLWVSKTRFNLIINIGQSNLHLRSSYYALHLEKYLNIILIYYESVWLEVWPQIKCRSLWLTFHSPVILPDILKSIGCTNIILMDYESVCQKFDLKINVSHSELHFTVQ